MTELLLKLPEDIKTKWLAALRSGEYKQVNNFMERKNSDNTVMGNCCLGVLSRVSGWTGDYIISGYPSTSEVGHIIMDVLDQALPADFPDNKGASQVGMFLYTVNDRWRWNFLQIADWIEEHL